MKFLIYKYLMVAKIKTKVAILLLVACLFCQYLYSAPKIILKLDDFRASNNTNNCKDVMDFLLQRQVKAGFGAIANSFDNTSLATLTSYLNATNTSNQKMFEIWNHGLDHACPEFSSQTYAYQKSHFEQANQLIKQYLGVQMHTLGTPCNTSDTITNRVIAENSNYKVFMFATVSPTNATGVTYLNNRVNIESSTGIPDSAYFVNNYFSGLSNFPDYMVLQAHPPLFAPAGFIEFKKCIDFLIKQGCEFMTPYEYYSYVTFAPSNLKLSVISDTQVNLSWQDKTTNEISYVVERSFNNKDWTIVATLPANSTAYSDQSITLATSTVLYYRVCAKTASDSYYSDIVRNNVSAKYFVDGTAGNDQNDGLTWGTALKSIEKASALAGLTSGIDDIYIKGGIYSLNSTWAVTSENFYGGCSGNESTPAERPLMDVDGNGKVEPWEFKYPTTIISKNNNTAVQLSAPNFNGFTISHTGVRTGIMSTVVCNSNGVFENNTISNSSLTLTASGATTLGGILVRAAGRLKNCLLEKNQVIVLINQVDDKPFAPIMDVALGTKVTGCVFRNNKVTVDCSASTAGPVTYGRGMIINTFGGVAGTASAISNCLIYNNEASYTGGGGTSSATMTYGSILCSSSYSTGASTDSIMNCTIANNKTNLMTCAGLLVQKNGTLLHYVLNNVFWNNQNMDGVGTLSMKNLTINSAVATGRIGYNVMNGGQSGGYTVAGITTDNLLDLSSTNSNANKSANFKLPTSIVGNTGNGSVELADWRLNAGSYLIGKGIACSNVRDISGNTFATARAVGAYEYVEPTGINQTQNEQPQIISVCKNGFSVKKSGNVRLFSLQGQVVKHENINEGQQIYCSAGIYICRITTNEGSFIQKINIK